MPRFSREPLRKMISLRLTEEDDRLLADMAVVLGLPGGKADVVRRALDYWLANAKEAKGAAANVRPKKEGG
jgi:hypothetical protein